MSAETAPSPPEQLKADTPEARLIRQKVWRAMNVENQHFMGAIVGREGSGKSWTALKIAELADPTFNAERVMFEPKTFLERLREWKEAGETTGKFVVADEAGVGLGVRTWYEKDQILFNQVLQVIRDENMGMLFTLPRLTELDSQARGRLHAFIEMTDLDAGNWAEFKWLNWDPTRDERDKTYRHYPEMKIDGYNRKLKRLKLSPPSSELVEGYQARKTAFQDELYDEALEEMEEEDSEDLSPQEVVDELKADERVSEVLSWHGGRNHWYVDKDLIRNKFDLSHSDASTAKKLLASDADIDVEKIGAQTERDT
ncbi:hypothetical protein ACKVMT_06185 [Halobacteriales archaeon Cl-PHB]